MLCGTAVSTRNWHWRLGVPIFDKVLKNDDCRISNPNSEEERKRGAGENSFVRTAIELRFFIGRDQNHSREDFDCSSVVLPVKLDLRRDRERK